MMGILEEEPEAKSASSTRSRDERARQGAREMLHQKSRAAEHQELRLLATGRARELFPSVDLNTALVLDEGKRPYTMREALAMMAGGVVVTLLGIGSFFVPR